MKTYFTKKGYGIINSLTFLISVSLFLSCNKVDLGATTDQQSFIQKNNGAKVVSSVSGFVTGENDEPVAGADVIAGNKACTTDEYGFFDLKGANVSAEAAVVTVSKNGYFNGIKTFKPAKGQDAFFRIKLIPQTTAGTINGAKGGTVSLHNGLSILFPAGGFVNEISGTVYNGTVKVAAFWINPAADDINEIMPGDLRGVNAGGEMKKLTSYGMAAVELTGASGEKLQLTPGKPATITIPMSASVSAHAPASIPLWYFDEVKGLWIEQGSATKKGNVYTGDVSHFTFWNCDWPQEFVEFECTAVNLENVPLSHVRVNIYEVSNPNNATGCYTNAQGYVSGLIPANTVLQLEILGDGACAGTPIYTQTITTANSNISLPLIIVNNNAGIGYVSGTIRDCNDNPVTNGGVFMRKDGQYYHYPVNNNGHYSFTTIVCNSTANISLMAHDAAASVYSPENIYTITTASNNNIDIQACGNSSSQFINYTINGVPYHLTYPAATFNPIMLSSIYSFSISSNTSNYFAGLQFSATNITANSIQQLIDFTPSQVTGPLTINTPIVVHITEAGESVHYVAGNFSGIFTGPAPNYTAYNITCSFRIECLF
jgi:hypothetical protein